RQFGFDRRGTDKLLCTDLLRLAAKDLLTPLICSRCCLQQTQRGTRREPRPAIENHDGPSARIESPNLAAASAATRCWYSRCAEAIAANERTEEMALPQLSLRRTPRAKATGVRGVPTLILR